MSDNQSENSEEWMPKPQQELGDRFMEILRAIHGEVPDAFADSARLAFVQAAKESARAQQAAPTDSYLTGGCTESNCSLCRTPVALRKPGQRHAGLTGREPQQAAKPQACECKTDAEIGLCTKPCERDAQPAAPQPAAQQEPVGWFESPHGAFRANPAYKMQYPRQILQWSVPLFIERSKT